jgi:hypothetical protein
VRRLLLAIGSWLLLTAAIPVEQQPTEALLGVPLLLTFTLPADDLHLADLPGLAPFELLAPPHRQGNRLQIIVLPLRPGQHTLPPLPLQGAGRQLSTAPLAIEVAEGIAEGASIAPLKTLPSPATFFWPLLAAGLALLGAALFYAVGKKPPAERPLDSLRGALLLEALQRLLTAEAGSGAEWQLLRRRLEELRFAPAPRPGETAEALLAEYRRLQSLSTVQERRS